MEWHRVGEDKQLSLKMNSFTSILHNFPWMRNKLLWLLVDSKDLLTRAFVDGWFQFFLPFSWIFTKAIQILKRQFEEMPW